MGSRLFVNGAVFDGHRHREDLAVLVAGGQVAAVDRPDVVRRHAAGAEVVDLHGGLLLPGFQDAHCHPLVGGLQLLTCELSSLSSVPDYLDAVADAAGRCPTGWVRGGGWEVEVFGPDGPQATQLDRVVADRPAFIVSADHHNAWVNTRALELAGVGADTPDPSDGWIGRDEHGRPTGALHEAAVLLVQDHVTTGRQEYAAALRRAQEHLHGWGVTGWHDALVGGYAALDDPTTAYLDLAAAGDLRSEVSAALWWDRHEGIDQLERLQEERAELGRAGVDARWVKVMMDGITETFTASVEEPYQGDTRCPCGDRGMAFLDRDAARAAVVALDGAGFGVHFHAIGDRAVHDALDAVAAARGAHGAGAHTHQAAHLQLVRPEDRSRLAELGVVANLQGMWVDRSSGGVADLLPRLGDERATWHYPFADIAAAGAALAGGSDWPVNEPEPMAGVHGLVNRTGWSADGEPAEPLVPEQALSLPQALHAYTAGSAAASRRTDSGALRPGTRADLVVLDRDPFNGPPEDIGACEVVTTWVAGELVFERDG